MSFEALAIRFSTHAKVSFLSVNLAVYASTVMTNLLPCTKVMLALRVSLLPMSTGRLKQILVKSSIMTQSSAYLQAATQPSSTISRTRKPPKILPCTLRSCVCMISQFSMSVRPIGVEVRDTSPPFRFRKSWWSSSIYACVGGFLSNEFQSSFLRRRAFSFAVASRCRALSLSDSLRCEKSSEGTGQPLLKFSASLAIMVKMEVALILSSCFTWISTSIDVLPTALRYPQTARSFLISIFSNMKKDSIEPVTQTILFLSWPSSLPQQWRQLTSPATESIISKILPVRTSLSYNLLSFSRNLVLVARGRQSEEQELRKLLVAGDAMVILWNLRSVRVEVKKLGTRNQAFSSASIGFGSTILKLSLVFCSRFISFLLQQLSETEEKRCGSGRKILETKEGVCLTIIMWICYFIKLEHLNE